MMIPSPEALGFPPKFSAWRPVQEAALHKMLTGTKRVDALCLPTGAGKSLLGIAYALITKKPTCYVTHSRGLQSQMMRDFGSVGLVDLRGRGNYQCEMRQDMSCEEGYASRCPYKGTVGCPSSQAEMRAAVSPLVVTNYAKWTAAKKFGQGMSHFQQVIFDEGHMVPDALAQAMQVTLNHKEIEEELGIPFPSHLSAEDMQNWKPWAAEARAEAEERLIGARAQLQQGGELKSTWVRHYLHMRNLVRRLSIISTARAVDWIVDEVERGYQFDPIRPGRYGEVAMLMKTPRIIIMSATLRPKSLFMTGISKEAFDFTEYDSEFDAKRMPVYWKPTMRVDSRAESLAPLWVLHDQIAARRQDRKGLVHTISYPRRDALLASSRFANRMFTNAKGQPATDAVEHFREAPQGSIFVSPSIGAGYDFPGSDAEWQFICKIPFPDGRNKILKARQEDDKEYGPYLAMQSFVQMCGRLMRGKFDQSESFTGDDHIEWFLPRYAHLAPRSFKLVFRRVEIVPPPPPPLGSR